MLKLRVWLTLIGALAGAWFMVLGVQNLIGSLIPMNGVTYLIVGGVLLILCGGVFVRCRG